MYLCAMQMNTGQLDEVELAYERAIARARDNDDARWLAVGLAQYRELYKAEFQEPPS